MPEMERVHPTTTSEHARAAGSAGPPRTDRRMPPPADTLRVGAAWDPLERAAQAAATAVVARIRERSSGPTPAGSPSSRIVRSTTPPAPAGAAGPSGGELDGELATRIRAAAGHGEALDTPTRDTMQRAFHADFGTVCVHPASDLPARLGASAFTLGHDIHFAPGLYQPSSSAGQHLVAHELAHVLQQSAGPSTIGRLHRSEVTIRRGTGSSTAKTETYHKLSEPDVTYKYVWMQDSAAGGLIDVFCDMEDGRIGYAAFTLQAVALMPAPAATEPMTKAHVLGRQAGVVCHLSQIFNLSLTRDGPDHIFSGFANTLMAMVEAKARTRGARLIYLEPSPSAVRTDPNTNDKKQQDPTGFYTTKHGYTADATAAIHNAAYTQQLYHGMDVSADDLARQTEQFNRAAVGGILIKLL